MHPEALNHWAELLKNLAELIVILAGGAGAYGILLLSKKPRVRIEFVAHWPPGPLSNASLVSVQFRLLNAAVGSKVVMEVDVDSLVFEQGKRRCVLAPYVIFDPLNPAKKPDATPEIREFSRAFVMIGCRQRVQHIGFLPDQDNVFALAPGSLSVRLDLKYVVHNPLFRIFAKPREKALVLEYAKRADVTLRESVGATSLKWAWLGRDLKELDL
jgi:hypothetical protein